MNKGLKQLIIVTFVLILFVIFFYNVVTQNIEDIEKGGIFRTNNSFKIISSSENQELEGIIQEFAQKNNYKIDVEYAGTLEIMEKLNNGESYDAVWLSNSIWMYMLESKTNISNSKCTSINPVIFGVTKSKAEELGFIGKDIYTQDILNSISSGKLKFNMPNPTTTNSGATAYLGFLSTLAGNPEVLKKDNLNDEELKTKLKTLFTGLERSSGSEEFLEEMFLNGDYDAVVTYESSIININKQLEKKGKEILYAIYPIDGVSISDSPFAYINNKDKEKKEIFTELQSYIISDEGQKLLQEKGRRTWYGGVSNTSDKNIFNPEWGIDTTKYISPTKYPNTEVIKLALNLYQNELRKPVHVVFCLDYSGSMAGKGIKELTDSMDFILTEKAANNFIQFSDKDKIDIVPFATKTMGIWSTQNGTQTEDILKRIKEQEPYGSTALYMAAQKGLEILKSEDQETYNCSIILMTDGNSNVGKYSDLENIYNSIKKEIPIYSIMFGSANQKQLQGIANLSKGKVFDGKTDLVKAFKEVRGYN